MTEAQSSALREQIAVRERVVSQQSAEEAAYRKLLGPAREYREEIAAINRVLALHPELGRKLGACALEDVRLRFLDTQDSAVAGVERGLIRLMRSYDDFASGAERSITSAFRGGEDALVDFVTKGKFEFSGFVDSSDFRSGEARDPANHHASVAR